MLDQHHSLIRSCSPTQLDMIGSERCIVISRAFLVYLATGTIYRI